DERGLGPGEPCEQALGVCPARSPLPRPQVELQARIAARDLRDRLDGLGCERSAAEVRMDDDARRIEHAAKAASTGFEELGSQAGAESVAIEPGQLDDRAVAQTFA